MPRIWRTCFRVSFRVASRTRMVNKMMARPIWLKQMTYSTTKVLTIGRMIISVQRNPMASKKPYLLAEISRLITLCILGMETPYL